MKLKFKLLIITLILSLFHRISQAQVITKEDSLNANLISKSSPTVLSGYGELKTEYDNEMKTAKSTITRAVLFFGHRFNEKIQFFSEWELENARVSNANPNGEFGLEQLFLKFNLNRETYFSAGLFIPRIGITNENHLPTTFNGNDRPYIETYLIPSTWREIGVGIYHSPSNIPGLNLSLAIINGLNSANFKNGSGIRDGRGDGSLASSKNLALTGSILYYKNKFRIQASSYFGGSCGLSQRQADSLGLQTGIFATPISLSEANIQYKNKAITIKGLACFTSIPDADAINQAYANNTPNSMIGAFAEIGIDLLNKKYDGKKSFIIFSRYEWFNLNLTLPYNGITNGINNQQHVIFGLSYLPIRNVVIKFDLHHKTTQDYNPALIINPYPQQYPYLTSRNFLNVGVGYSF